MHTSIKCSSHSYLESILQLRDERILRDEGEELALHGERQRYDEAHEDHHLEHEKGEDLQARLSVCCCSGCNGEFDGPERRLTKASSLLFVDVVAEVGIIGEMIRADGHLEVHLFGAVFKEVGTLTRL